MEDRSLAGTGYKLDRDSGVWVSKDYRGFAYSDGDATEKSILEAVRSARDVSCASDELPAKIKDWPSEYHLSPVRANIVAPFRIGRGTRVLELGCGMGAITRRLGETGAEVVAVEGSLRRAEIARERCRDLRNVRIVCDNFRDYRSEGKFDIVTLIGVMEYSPKFIGGDDPIGGCLAVAKGLLAPDGSVIIAIENRLGLKYWNNCAEDHTGGMFDSIHDTYRPGTVTTFGYEELKRILGKAGFASVDFLFPFPDYKLPSVILREKSLGQEGVSFASIIGQHFSRDYSGGRHRHFSERLAWRMLERNGLIPHFANSLLCVCAPSHDARPVIPEDWLVKLYNSSRSACFRTETTIYRDRSTDAIRVSKERRYPELPTHQGPLTFNPDVEKNFIGGALLSDEILKSLLRHDTLDEFFRKMNDYKEAVVSIGRSFKPGIGDGYCPGELVDCTPFNLVRTTDGALRYIDNEWIVEGDLPLKFVLLRGIFHEITGHVHFIDNPSLFLQFGTLGNLVARIFKELGLVLSPEDVDLFCRYEGEIQAQVTEVRNSAMEIADRTREILSGPIDTMLGISGRLPVGASSRMRKGRFGRYCRKKTEAAKKAFSRLFRRRSPRPPR